MALAYGAEASNGTMQTSDVHRLNNWNSMMDGTQKQEAQLSLTNCATLFCKVVEVLQDLLSENVDNKFTTDYNVA